MHIEQYQDKLLMDLNLDSVNKSIDAVNKKVNLIGNKIGDGAIMPLDNNNNGMVSFEIK